MSFFIDLIIIAVFVVSIILGWRRGFVRSITGVVSIAGAVAATYFLYTPVSRFFYDKIFLNNITGYVQSAFDRDIGATGKSVSDLFSELPEFFTNFLNRFSTQAAAEEYYRSNPDSTSAELSRFLAEPIASTVSKVVAVVALFFVSFIIFKLLTALLDKVVKLPLLNGVNRALGLVFGALVGISVVWVLSIAVHALLPQLVSLYPTAFKDSTFDNTVITSKLYNFNLFKVLDLFKF